MTDSNTRADRLAEALKRNLEQFIASERAVDDEWFVSIRTLAEEVYAEFRRGDVDRNDLLDAVNVLDQAIEQMKAGLRASANRTTKVHEVVELEELLRDVPDFQKIRCVRESREQFTAHERGRRKRLVAELEELRRTVRNGGPDA